MSAALPSNKKAKKQALGATESYKEHLSRERKKIASKQKRNANNANIFEIPYTYPPYTGGTCLTDATETYEEMKRIVEDKTKADPTCWNNITLISLRFESGPHFGVSLADAHAALERQNAIAGGLTLNADGKYIPTQENTIFIGGLPNQTTEDDIRAAFPYKIRYIERPLNEKNPSVKKPIAFVEFETKAIADSIKGLPAGSVTICGVPVRVSAAEGDRFSGNNNNNNNNQMDVASGSNEVQQNNNNNNNNAATNAIDADPRASRVAAINNLLAEGENIDEDLINELGRECSSFGEVVNIAFYQADDANSDSSYTSPTAAIEYAKPSQALACVQRMNGRMFDKKILTAGLMDMELYNKVKN